MIHVIATIELQPDRREDFLKEFRALVPAVQAEVGCIAYGPTVDVETTIPAQGSPREHVVTVVEQWESLDALADHLMAEHMLAYRKKVKEMVVGMTLQVLEPA